MVLFIVYVNKHDCVEFILCLRGFLSEFFVTQNIPCFSLYIYQLTFGESGLDIHRFSCSFQKKPKALNEDFLFMFFWHAVFVFFSYFLSIPLRFKESKEICLFLSLEFSRKDWACAQRASKTLQRPLRAQDNEGSLAEWYTPSPTTTATATDRRRKQSAAEDIAVL